MWTAGEIEDEENANMILAWLPKRVQDEIKERADLHIWWQENEGGWDMNDKTKALVKHTYLLASSQALSEVIIDWKEDYNGG